MKKLIVLFVLGIFFQSIFAQNTQTHFHPLIWLRADNAGTTNNQWNDISGHGYNATTQNNQTKPDTGLFNYQTCFLFDSLSKPMKINYTAKRNSKYLILAVYKPTTTQQEKGIWMMGLDSAIQVKLSTQKLKNVYKFIKYNDSTSTIPTINSLTQNWKNKHIDTTMSYLLIGGSDSLNFTGKFAEFLLFDTTMSINQIDKIHTYLAVKYGISLIKMNYTASNDSILWNYETNIAYKNDIASIGKDTLLYVNQKQSAGNGGESPLKISAGNLKTSNTTNTTQLQQGDFLVWGNNGKPLSETNQDTSNTLNVNNMSKSVWLMKNTGATSNLISTQVIISAKEFTAANRVALVINRFGNELFPVDSSEIFYSDSLGIDSNYYFNNIFWDSDNSGTDVFGFQILKSTNRISHNSNNQQNQNIDNTNPILDCSLFPNPSLSNYQLTIKLNQELPIKVTITDVNGKLIEILERNGASEYQLKGYIKDNGCYQFKVESGKETKTYKLIVQ